MSILMAALKQQQHHTPAVIERSSFWRKLALLLALLLAVLTGAIAAYVLLPLLTSDKNDNAEVVTPAAPATILAALKTVETKAAADAALSNLAAGLTEAIAPPPEPVQEQFDVPPPVATVTAGTVAAEPKPMMAEPVAAVSAELRDKFASALKATELSNTHLAPQQSNNAPAPDINNLDAELQRQIPPLRFEAHVYATATNQRWVKVNGKTLQEGQWITADIRIKEITPQFVLLQRGNQLFSMPALSAWPH
jgi:general secretion pathway protein B